MDLSPAMVDLPLGWLDLGKPISKGHYRIARKMSRSDLQKARSLLRRALDSQNSGKRAHHLYGKRPRDTNRNPIHIEVKVTTANRNITCNP